VNLPPRLTLFLLLVVEAWIQDEGKVRSQRGFRTKAELSPRLGNPANTSPVSETTVASYVRAIRAEIKRAVDALRLPEGCELRIPNLIESQRGLGYRIGPCGLEILQPRPSLLLTT
jgi:hypothetical protein